MEDEMEASRLADDNRDEVVSGSKSFLSRMVNDLGSLLVVL